jgi:tetratricopeptide (TPR) repeat protein
MISQLSGRRLIKVQDLGGGREVYSIHRLLQQKILLDMNEIQFENSFRKAFRLIRKRYPKADPQQVPDPGNWKDCKDYMRHVFSFHRVFVETPSIRLHKVFKDTEKLKPSQELAQLFYDAGFYVWARQTTAYDGLSFLETAESILDEMGIDPGAKIRADIHCITGLLYMKLGSLERAESLRRFQSALGIRKQIYLEHPEDLDSDVLFQNAAVDYSLCLLDLNRFEDAEKIWGQCLTRYNAWGGEKNNPFEFGKYYGNMSIVLMWQGKIHEAIKYVERSIELTEKFAGKTGQYWRRQFLLGCIFLQAGKYDDALVRHLETRSARMDLLGKHHQSTILSTYAVGAMYDHIGDAATAM